MMHIYFNGQPLKATGGHKSDSYKNNKVLISGLNVNAIYRVNLEQHHTYTSLTLFICKPVTHGTSI